MCLDPSAIGRTYRLHARRPGPEINRRLTRADLVGFDGAVEVAPEESATVGPVVVTRVDVQGALEQRAGYHDPCSAWTDGHDALSERLCAALLEGDVLLVLDSPGGAVAGCEEGVRRVVELKASLGRRITGYANEMIGSAAYWWAACVCDEIYGPPAMIVGSIGSRGAHGSVAGALAQEGIEMTFACWPDAGKLAGVPELPLSEEGKARLDRYVAEAGEAFAAAVGPPRGLSRDDIVALHADALRGQAAVKAKLVDGVASLEDVMAYTLAQAGAEGKNMSDKPGEPEGGDDKDMPDATKCAKCGEPGSATARFCARCGDPMSGAKAATDEEKDDEEDPESTKPNGNAATPTARGSSYAAIAGLRPGASDPAIKAELLRKMSVYEFAATLTGAKVAGQINGGLKAIAEDAARTAKMERELKAERVAAGNRQRWDLAHKLAAANVPGRERGKIFIDDFHPDTHERTGMHLAKEYAEMKLDTFEGLVNGLTSGREASKRDPYRPSEESAAAAGGAGYVSPTVNAMAQKSGLDPETLAKAEQYINAQLSSGQ